MIGVTLLVLCALVCTVILRRRSAAVRHWVLSSGDRGGGRAARGAALAPAWPIGRAATTALIPADFPAPPVVRDTAGGRRQRSAGGRRSGRPSSGAAVWVAGDRAQRARSLVAASCACAGCLRAGSGFVTADGMPPRGSGAAGRARPERDAPPEHHPSLLVTWGALRPKIILPVGADDWPDDRVRAVLLHEIAHIKRGDWVWQIAAEALRAVYWFNPIVWIACGGFVRRANAHATTWSRTGVSASEYAAHLLAVARITALSRRAMFPQFPAPAMVQPSSLERRIVTMLKPNIDRRPATRLGPRRCGIRNAAPCRVIAALGAAAQSLATFSGSVVDPMSLGVPRVTLVLTHQQTKAKHEVRSDDKGLFEFAGLPAGVYDLEAKLPGFASLTGPGGNCRPRRAAHAETGTRHAAGDGPRGVQRLERSATAATTSAPPPARGGVPGGVPGGRCRRRGRRAS